MIEIQELKIIMDSFLLQLICGYAFVSVFNLVLLKRTSKDITHILLSSFAIGYVIIFLTKIIPISFGTIIDSILVCIFSIIIAYVLGLIFSSNVIENILEKLHIYQSAHPNTWAELMDKTNAMRMEIKMNDGTKYFGYVHHIGEESPTLIGLVAYSINDVFDIKNNEVIVLNSGEAEYIKIIYDKRSKYIERINDFAKAMKCEIEHK